MKKNKISILVSNDIATDQRMHRICKSLVGCGFEIEIAGRKLHNSGDLPIEDFKQFRHKLFFKQGPFFYLELNIRHFLFLLKYMPDGIYAVDADTAIAACFYSKLFGKKVIFDAHELFSEVPELEGRYFVKKVWKFIEKLIIKNSDLRITVSQSVATYFEKLYNQKFEVIRNLPLKKEKSETENLDKYIIYQGALNKGRCIEQLINATALTQIDVKIAGEGDLSFKLRKLVKKLKLTDKIKFLGNVKPENLHEITSKAWLGFNVLENCGLSYFFSLSNKTFDYIQAGIPQLMPDFPEYLSLNEKYNFGLTIESNVEKIAETIIKLYNDEKLYNSLQNGAAKESEVLIWENEEAKLAEIVKNLFENI